MVNIEIEQKKNDIAMAVTTTLAQVGLISGELTYAAAHRMYGGWFTNAVKNGKISPSRFGAGKKATKYFLVSDILAYRAVELERAQIILSK